MDSEAARRVRARAQARLHGEMRGRPPLERLGLCVDLIGEIVTSAGALNDSVGPGGRLATTTDKTEFVCRTWLPDPRR
jgi:hypothetical protein